MCTCVRHLLSTSTVSHENIASLFVFSNNAMFPVFASILCHCFSWITRVLRADQASAFQETAFDKTLTIYTRQSRIIPAQFQLRPAKDKSNPEYIPGVIFRQNSAVYRPTKRSLDALRQRKQTISRLYGFPPFFETVAIDTRAVY